jgi:predicted phosphodiesterase
MNVLVIGDLHLPAERKGYLSFCKQVYKDNSCNQVVFIGDIIDWHAISRHVKEPQCPGPQDEYDAAKKLIQVWCKAFPEATVTLGNHDSRPERMAKCVNIPKSLLRTQEELWNTPKWKWVNSCRIDNVLYKHGTGLGGIHPAWTALQAERGNVVIGHCHARAEIVWSASRRDRIFGMSVGCGIDQEAYQFAYGQELKDRPMLSVGVVKKGIPLLVPMACGKGELFHDSRFK